MHTAKDTGASSDVKVCIVFELMFSQCVTIRDGKVEGLNLTNLSQVTEFCFFII